MLLVGLHKTMAKAEGGEVDREAFKSYVPTVEMALKRVRDMEQTVDVRDYSKMAADLLAMADETGTGGLDKMLGEAQSRLDQGSAAQKKAEGRRAFEPERRVVDSCGTSLVEREVV